MFMFALLRTDRSPSSSVSGFPSIQTGTKAGSDESVRLDRTQKASKAVLMRADSTVVELARQMSRNQQQQQQLLLRNSSTQVRLQAIIGVAQRLAVYRASQKDTRQDSSEVGCFVTNATKTV